MTLLLVPNHVGYRGLLKSFEEVYTIRLSGLHINPTPLLALAICTVQYGGVPEVLRVAFRLIPEYVEEVSGLDGSTRFDNWYAEVIENIKSLLWVPHV
jgi:hypothetical protein